MQTQSLYFAYFTELNLPLFFKHSQVKNKGVKFTWTEYFTVGVWFFNSISICIQRMDVSWIFLVFL